MVVKLGVERRVVLTDAQNGNTTGCTDFKQFRAALDIRLLAFCESWLRMNAFEVLVEATWVGHSEESGDGLVVPVPHTCDLSEMSDDRLTPLASPAELLHLSTWLLNNSCPEIRSQQCFMGITAAVATILAGSTQPCSLQDLVSIVVNAVEQQIDHVWIAEVVRRLSLHDLSSCAAFFDSTVMSPTQFTKVRAEYIIALLLHFANTGQDWRLFDN